MFNHQKQAQMQESKIMSLPALLQRLETDRQAGKKIVFTNGCFDILHRGHATYLREARRLGDRLVIGLNTDASVKRLKGESRPINHEDDRAYLLESLEAVDYVVKFAEDTPYELLSQLRPDVLVKGGDYRLEQVIGREFADEVVLINFVEGYSTTRTIQQLQQGN
ncbi:MAG: D-glycero-beta-D-manno-heptose 1-phosphate adenylyltransferase [Cyclobacteriaceae bacterium]